MNKNLQQHRKKG